MLIRLLSILTLAVAFSGCASTQMKQQNEQLESRVTDLEKAQQSKDAEIVDLQYQVKDLSSKMDSIKPGSEDNDNAAAPSGDQETGAAAGPASSDVGSGGTNIVRVKVSVEKIQRALKAAGVYTGAVDGKLGPGTKEAIIEFQKTHDLKADGVLGHHTWDMLKTYLK